ncbi:PREDICTED: thrombospondin type-1 domain-containing protein 4-like [Ficedula albicollis]|uniref:thrombospondin type-1 domain-containing protein 4-like n=1 Tax=Ficedula albicollis TaxID=59894 RepID=UPI0007AD92E3|nr:PREDICTED: thrombospondin type-1 domain-containing protein 4-like [Ficedula albicollis]
MVDSLIVSLRLLSSLAVLGFQFVIPQPSIEHRKVPQRIEEQGDAPEDSGAGVPGLWGSWGPWSACSRSCSGGVMEQTRPCLPAYYRERYRRPGRHFPASERPPPGIPLAAPLPCQAFTPVGCPLLLWWPLQASTGWNGGEQSLQDWLGQETMKQKQKSYRSREVRLWQSALHLAAADGHRAAAAEAAAAAAPPPPQPQKPRRQRQSSRGALGSYGPAAAPSLQHGSLYQEPAAPQPGHHGLGPSLYHPPAFPASQSLFHGADSSPQALQGQPQPQRAAAIVCIGAYKQYKLCNTNMCPESSRNIREVQCASYNNKPFMGRFYEWEPFAEASLLSNLVIQNQLGQKRLTGLGISPQPCDCQEAVSAGFPLLEMCQNPSIE